MAFAEIILSAMDNICRTPAKKHLANRGRWHTVHTTLGKGRRSAKADKNSRRPWPLVCRGLALGNVLSSAVAQNKQRACRFLHLTVDLSQKKEISPSAIYMKVNDNARVAPCGNHVRPKIAANLVYHGRQHSASSPPL